MDDFNYHSGQLLCEQVKLDELTRRVGTPVYIYSKHTLTSHYDHLAAAFADLNPLICYSIKSCGNIHICTLLAARGAGMDVVSGGELYRAQHAGVQMNKVVYAGVGKTDREIVESIRAKIGFFNIESEAECENIASIARQMGVVCHAALRVNPNVADPKTPDKTRTGSTGTKFGVDIDRVAQFFRKYGHDPNLQLTGIHLHIGSPIYSADPYVHAINKALELIDQLRADGSTIKTLNMGGGFAADYESSQSPTPADYAARIVPLLRPFVQNGGRIILEPGRMISGNAGALLTRVQYVKRGGGKKFIIVDSGENHLIRPAMYDSFHFIWPTQVALMHEPKQRQQNLDMPGLERCDVVGPICETGDFFAKDRLLPPVTRGDLLCIFTAGAYGMAMASNYNAMPRPAEILIDGANATIIRRRETYDDLIAAEVKMEAV